MRYKNDKDKLQTRLDKIIVIIFQGCEILCPEYYNPLCRVLGTWEAFKLTKFEIAPSPPVPIPQSPVVPALYILGQPKTITVQNQTYI